MKISKKPCNLGTCAMCRFCLPEWLPAIDLHRRNFEIKKGELIFKEGDPVTGIYFVNSGAVKVHKQWGEGDKELILRFAKQGDIFGHRGLGEHEVFPVSATAIQPSVICYIELQFFLATLKVNTGYLYNLMMFFAEDLRISEQRMRDLAHKTVKGRIATALITLAKKFGITPKGLIGLRISRQDLASYTGTTYETVFRMLTELQEEGLIRQHGKDIALVDEKGLQAIAERQG